MDTTGNITPLPTRETQQVAPSSPDPLSTQPTTTNPLNQPAIQRKRLSSPSLEQQRTPNPPIGSFSFMSTYARAPISTVREGIQIARDALVQAANVSASNDEQTQLLDLIEILRDYTESGRIRKQQTAILTSQISRLDAVTKTVSKALNAKPSSRPIPTSQNTPQQATPIPTLSYANAAAKNLPKTTEWTTVTSKKKTTHTTTPKNSLSSRQLILTQDQSTLVNSLALRNKINDAFASNGIKSPVIASATTSFKKNIVLTTTPAFNAKYLLENKNIWANIISFQEALPVSPWYKDAIHGIPTNLDNLDILKSEISTFNNGLQVVGEPYWLSSESNRRIKQAGRICLHCLPISKRCRLCYKAQTLPPRNQCKG